MIKNKFLFTTNALACFTLNIIVAPQTFASSTTMSASAQGEIVDYAAKIAALNTDYAANIASLVKKINDLNADKKSKEADNEKSKAHIVDLQKYIADRPSPELSSIRKQIEVNEQLIASEKKKMADNTSAIKKNEADLKTKNLDLQKLQAQQKADIASVAAEKALEEKSAYLKTKTAERLSKVKSAEEQLAVLQSEYGRLVNENELLKKTRDDIEKEIRDTQSQIKENRDKKEKLTKINSEIRSRRLEIRNLAQKILEESDSSIQASEAKKKSELSKLETESPGNTTGSGYVNAENGMPTTSAENFGSTVGVAVPNILPPTAINTGAMAVAKTLPSPATDTSNSSAPNLPSLPTADQMQLDGSLQPSTATASGVLSNNSSEERTAFPPVRPTRKVPPAPVSADPQSVFINPIPAATPVYSRDLYFNPQPNDLAVPTQPKAAAAPIALPPTNASQRINMGTFLLKNKLYAYNGVNRDLARITPCNPYNPSSEDSKIPLFGDLKKYNIAMMMMRDFIRDNLKQQNILSGKDWKKSLSGTNLTSQEIHAVKDGLDNIRTILPKDYSFDVESRANVLTLFMCRK